MSNSTNINVTITSPDGDILQQLEISSEETLENLKALLEVQLGVVLNEQRLFFEGKELKNNQASLKQIGVKNFDVLLLHRAETNNVTTQAQEFIQYVKSDPQLLQRLKNMNPSLVDAIQKGDTSKVSQFLLQQTEEKRKKELEEQARINLINADPFNPEFQKQIEEEIRLGNINENMEHALENNPEFFTRVLMLYVDCSVNGVDVKAFVDSGAQQTIMSRACAKRCGIERLIDSRYHGIAKGVGEAKIVGRVHLAPIKLGSSFFPCSFTILEDQGVEFLLGLDMLRRHQCCIDLKDNVLRLGTEAIPFLAERDIPQSELFSEIPNSPRSSQPISLLTPPSSPHPTASTSSSHAQSQPPPSMSIPNLIPNLSTPQIQPSARSSFPDSSIKQLMELGFTREEVIQALTVCKGNVDAAASFLFSG